MKAFVHIVRGVAPLVAATLLAACGGSPDKGPQDSLSAADARDIAIGEQNFGLARQSRGGDYVVDPALADYVRGVGTRLAAAVDRRLAWEFVVLDEGVPDAWSLPGGKVAVTRGLLLGLKSEAELAAVLSHEIAHSAARSGERGIEGTHPVPGTNLAVGNGTRVERYADLYVEGAQAASQMVATRHAPGAEAEADSQGMVLMKRAGYDPAAAVALGERFVRLAADKSADFAGGLFASHPPSMERIGKARETLSRLGAGGEVAEQRYLEKTAALVRTRPAFDAREAGTLALEKGDMPTAQTAVARALALEPREPGFHELKGDVDLTLKRYDRATAAYDEAIRLRPGYFKPYVQSGVVLFAMGRRADAEPLLRKSLELLPTAPAHFLLGLLAEDRGKAEDAMQHFQIAAGSSTELGRLASAHFVKLDLPRNPRRYLQADVQVAKDGTLYALLQNAAPASLFDIRIRLARSEGGKVVEKSEPYAVTAPIPPGKTALIPMAKANSMDQQVLDSYQIIVESVAAAR